MIGKIIEKNEVAEDTLAVSFQLPGPMNFKPGQYVFITLKNPPYTDEEGNKRHFSINNPPSQKGVLTITTRITKSAYKRSLRQLPLETEVEMGPVAGIFTLPENQSRPLVFIAGGIGITPFLSMLSHIAENNLPYKITLLYSNRNQASTAYLQQLENFKFEIKNFKLITTMTEDPQWTGEKRMISAQFIKEYFGNVNNNFYMVVGPPAMVDAAEKALLEAGVLSENIKKENFTGY